MSFNSTSVKSLNGEYFKDTSCKLTDNNTTATPTGYSHAVYGNVCIEINSGVTHRWTFKVKNKCFKGISIGIVDTNCMLRNRDDYQVMYKQYNVKCNCGWFPTDFYMAYHYKEGKGLCWRTTSPRYLKGGGSFYSREAYGFQSGDIVEMVFNTATQELLFMTNGSNECKLEGKWIKKDIQYKMFVHFSTFWEGTGKCVELLSYDNNQNEVEFQKLLKGKNSEIKKYKDMVEKLQNQMQQIMDSKEILAKEEEKEVEKHDIECNEWEWEQILSWMLQLDDGRYRKYENNLTQNLKEEEPTGDDLRDIDAKDLKRWGIKKFGDIKAMLRDIEKLTSSKS